MIVSSGDILDIEKGVIAHQVNTLGIMGGGVAKSLKNKYTGLEESYILYIKNTKDELLGKMHYFNVNDNLVIANCFAQNDISKGYYDKTCYTQYTVLRESLTKAFELSISLNLRLYVPYKIGCGLANGDWKIVTQILLDLESKFHKDIYVVKFNKKER